MKRFVVFVLIFSFIIISCSKPGDATVMKGMEAFKNQQLDVAAEHFKTALETESNYSKELICSFLAKIYTLESNYEEAAVYYEKSLENGGDYLTFVSLGMTYHMLKKEDKAIETYQRAINFDPKRSEAYASIGALELGRKNFDEAIKNLSKAVEIFPNLAVAHGNLALCYAEKGNKEKCFEELALAEANKCENFEEFKLRCEEKF